MSFESYQCPKTGTPLQKAGQKTIQLVNRAIEEKSVFTAGGEEVEKVVSGLWICPETKRGFAERDGIVCLIPSESFRLRKLAIDFSELN